MRQIVIDEISREERANIHNYLKRNAQAGAMEGMFWLPLPERLLAEAQHGHEGCGPYFFGIELTDDRLVFELLVRSKTNLHCSCISYATPEQRDFLLAFVDKMLAEEMIRA